MATYTEGNRTVEVKQVASLNRAEVRLSESQQVFLRRKWKSSKGIWTMVKCQRKWGLLPERRIRHFALEKHILTTIRFMCPWMTRCLLIDRLVGYWIK